MREGHAAPALQWWAPVASAARLKPLMGKQLKKKQGVATLRCNPLGVGGGEEEELGFRPLSP